jgi:hypothetical protein
MTSSCVLASRAAAISCTDGELELVTTVCAAATEGMPASTNMLKRFKDARMISSSHLLRSKTIQRMRSSRQLAMKH